MVLVHAQSNLQRYKDTCSSKLQLLCTHSDRKVAGVICRGHEISLGPGKRGQMRFLWAVLRIHLFCTLFGLYRAHSRITNPVDPPRDYGMERWMRSSTRAPQQRAA